ncbi:hypothetical protein B0H13DRAFT_1905902 [Mycena leptocephala]|nr:hypothetical protein B0H13DRAFT_1905902 [Mycena leptocephala]
MIDSTGPRADAVQIRFGSLHNRNPGNLIIMSKAILKIKQRTRYGVIGSRYGARAARTYDKGRAPYDLDFGCPIRTYVLVPKSKSNSNSAHTRTPVGVQETFEQSKTQECTHISYRTDIRPAQINFVFRFHLGGVGGWVGVGAISNLLSFGMSGRLQNASPQLSSIHDV